MTLHIVAIPLEASRAILLLKEMAGRPETLNLTIRNVQIGSIELPIDVDGDANGMKIVLNDNGTWHMNVPIVLGERA